MTEEEKNLTKEELNVGFKGRMIQFLRDEIKDINVMIEVLP